MLSNNHKRAETKADDTSGLVNLRPKSAMTNAGWNAFFSIFNGVISFFLIPLLIHYLGIQQFGILLLMWSITGILGLANFGLGEATLRYIAYHYGDRDISGVNRVLGSTLSFLVVICAVLSVVVFAAAPIFVVLLKIPASEHRLVGWLLRFSALVFFLGTISRAIGTIPMALQRYDISSKINIGQGIVRSGGYILLVISKYGILHLVIWDVVTCLGTLCVQSVVARNLLPGVKLMPSFSFKGLREIVSYSISSLLTYIFLVIYRESGKLVLGTNLGPIPVAYLGTPDNVAQRIYAVIVSGSETLMPRFSANRDPKVAQSLFLNGTWISLGLSILFFVPLAVFMPDFLRLWINPEFARESAAVGQFLALSIILQGTFVTAATFFRGTGKPWIVTIVIAIAGVGTFLLSVILIPAYGVLGVGYAYFIGSIPWLVGLFYGWYFMFGSSSVIPLVRVVGLPLLLAGGAFAFGTAFRGWFNEVNWFGLFGLGGLFAGSIGLILFGIDWVLGGESPSKQLLERIYSVRQIDALSRRINLLKDR